MDEGPAMECGVKCMASSGLLYPKVEKIVLQRHISILSITRFRDSR